MISYSVIQKSQLEGAHRLDAEYYQPEYLDRLNALERIKSEYLQKFTDKIDVGYVSSMKEEFLDEGIPLLRTQNVREFSIDLESDLVYINGEFHKRLKKSEIFPGYVLLARSGTIGDAAIVPQDFPRANSADIIAIKTKDNLLPEFLAAFLNSQYGRFQIDRLTSGGIQGHINLFSLEKLLIPRFSMSAQKSVRDLVLQGLSILQISQSYYDDAEKFLLHELGVDEEIEENEVATVVNFSDIKNAHRTDAEFFQKKYKRLYTLIKSHAKVYSLSDVATVKRGSLIDPKYYTDQEGVPYIRGKDFSSWRLQKESMVYIDASFKPTRETRLKKDDIVFASIGSVGTTALVTPSFDGAFISNNTGRIRINDTKDIFPDYLAIVFHSIIGQLQFQRWQTQTAQPKISDEQVRQIEIPVLPIKTQKRIADLVQQSFDARGRAKQLLEEAKHKVEEMIENESAKSKESAR